MAKIVLAPCGKLPLRPIVLAPVGGCPCGRLHAKAMATIRAQGRAPTGRGFGHLWEAATGRGFGSLCGAPTGRGFGHLWEAAPAAEWLLRLINWGQTPFDSGLIQAQPPRIQPIEHRLRPRVHAAQTSQHVGGPVKVSLLAFGRPICGWRGQDVAQIADLVTPLYEAVAWWLAHRLRGLKPEA